MDVLASFLSGLSQTGTGAGTALINPTDGSALIRASSEGLDIAAGLDFARTVGGPALRPLGYAARAALLGRIADRLTLRRDDWYRIARENAGNTKADAAIDIDGAIGTLKYFAKLGASLGDGMLLADGGDIRLARDPNFQGRHIGVPLRGVAIHINAFNFPAWGLWGKAAVALLAGVPVLAKPATATAWLAQEMVRDIVEAGILPVGALSLLCGAPGRLLDHVRFGDTIAFTGSAATGRAIRRHPQVEAEGVRVNIEADSLNAALLGPDGDAASFDGFVREVVREMTAKAGQKCTAIRRVLVPAAQAQAVADAIAALLDGLAVGHPADPTVAMGPLVSKAQQADVEAGIAKLSRSTAVAYRKTGALVDADAAKGAFVMPTLLTGDADLVHDLEVFGPVATIVPYAGAEEAFALARRGGGSLAASVFSADLDFLGDAAVALGDSHGRLLLVDPSVTDSQTGHGIVLPSLLHGGPGRAGDGAELGGLKGLWFYHQRTALQGSAATLAQLTGRLSQE
jgi:3,4-dehydroadipyl-CoA semialdehyde dehydrogenase